MKPLETHGLIMRVEKFHRGMIPQWMLHDHFREVAQVMRTIVDKPDPDYGIYEREQEKGHTVFVAVRDHKVLNLVGYVGLLLKPHPHYRGITMAIDDAYYLMPGYREVGVGTLMMRYAEAAAAEAGAQMMFIRVKSQHSHGSLLERLGYQLEDLTYKKDLRHVAQESAAAE